MELFRHRNLPLPRPKASHGSFSDRNQRSVSRGIGQHAKRAHLLFPEWLQRPELPHAPVACGTKCNFREHPMKKHPDPFEREALDQNATPKSENILLNWLIVVAGLAGLGLAATMLVDVL